MSEQTTYRDEQLGAALRALDVPEHAPGFERELARRLAKRRGHGRRWLLAAAVITAAAAAAAIGIPRTAGVASAAEVKEKVRVSLAALHDLSGVLVEDGPQRSDVRRWRFTLTAGGDFRLVGPSAGEVVTYDAAAGVARSVQHSASLGGDTLFYAERRGVAPGPPDAGPPTWLLPREYGAFVRALLAADDPRVQEVDYEGRLAWQVDVDVVPNAIVPDFSGDRLELTVDRETGIPVRVVERKAGSFVRELRIERLALDTRPGRDAFRLRFPDGAEVLRSDEGFRRVPLREAVDVVGYEPLVPGWLPEGYELAEVAVARAAGPTGVEAGNPPSRLVVSLAYRRGLDRLLVTTRLAQGGPWSDPLATGEGFRDEPEQVTLRGGALAGARAELLVPPRGIPHLWAQARGLVVTVGGDAGRAELLRVAGSVSGGRAASG